MISNNGVKEVIIHFGLAKTGTTYLQEYLACNRDHLLNAYGILYPSGGSNHFHFQTILSDDPYALIQVRREGLLSKDSVDEFVERFKTDFILEVNEKRPEKLLISSEYFSSMTDAEFPRLRSFFKGFSDNITPIVYMRDPWSHSVSATQQDIRGGFLKAPVRMGYRTGQVKLIKRMEALFGPDLIVRPYFGGKEKKTNIIEDFLSLLNLPSLPNLPVDDAAGNQSLGRIATTMLAELNKVWPQFDQEMRLIYSPVRDQVVNAIVSSDSDGHPLRLSKKIAEKIFAYSKDDLEYIHNNYFSGREVFHEYYSRQQFRDFDCDISLENIKKSEIVGIAFDAITKLIKLN